MVNNYISICFKTVCSYLLLELSGYLKGSYVVGTKRLFFSGINCSGPLINRFSGIGALLLYTIRHLLVFSAGNPFFNPLVYHIPTFIASAYWYSTNKAVRLLLPAACMAAFILHPVGYQAFFYSGFWLIPMIIHLLPVRNPFLEALGTTFIAHAIGSVLVLYMNPLPAAMWLSLMPVVVIERLLFATGMTCIYYAAITIKRLIEQYESPIYPIQGYTFIKRLKA